MTEHVKPVTPSHVLFQIHFPYIPRPRQGISDNLKPRFQHNFLLILPRELHGTIDQRGHHPMLFRVITHVKFRPQHRHASPGSMHQKRFRCISLHLKISLPRQQVHLPAILSKTYRELQPGISIHPHFRSIRQHQHILPSPRDIQLVISNSIRWRYIFRGIHHLHGIPGNLYPIRLPNLSFILTQINPGPIVQHNISL